MGPPKVSVIIPCYNHGRYLPEAIASVWQQTFRPYEIILVNDGSTDPETLEIISRYDTKDIKILHTTNRGLAAARNYGISHACGKYIIPLDADDQLAPGYLSAAIQELESDPQVGIVYGLVEFFEESSGIWPQAEFSVTRLLYENMIVASAVFRHADWERVGGYREAMCHGWEDWDFWISLVERGRKVIRLPEVVFYYRIRKNSMTRTLTHLQKLRMLLCLMRNHPRLYTENFWPFLLGLVSNVASRRR